MSDDEGTVSSAEPSGPDIGDMVIPATAPRPRHPTLKESAALLLREQILTGKLKPGAKIDQNGFAAALGMSKLPVREALIELAQEGLVVTTPRRGTFVAQLDRIDVKDHYWLAGCIVGHTASRAAVVLTEENLDELEDLHERFVASVDLSEMTYLDNAFHDMINRAGGSTRLRSFLRLLMRSLSIPTHFFEFFPGWSATAALHHRHILDALRERNPEKAAQLSESHLQETGKLAIQILEEWGYWA